MDEILKEVKTFDTKTLREKLLEHGIKIGPIPQGTISLFQNRLAKELFRLQGGVSGEECADESQPVKENRVTALDEKRETTFSNVSDVFYAVCLPENVEQDIHDPATADQLVFSDKDLALTTAKKYKGSRFKVFKTEPDARLFSRLTAESAFQSPRRPSKEDTPVKETQPSTESTPFKAPRPQDMAQLRKVIEKGDVDAFKEQVQNNPRFLVSSGDTPAMYQEGPRYTAMHVAAAKNKPEICQVILDVLEDPQFINNLYCQSIHTEESQNSRINFLVDLYLNMPDKGSCESPLHMACKFGNTAVVEILAAHPRTDKQLKNKWGDTPRDIICSRCPSMSPSVKKRIEDLLQGQCYVPLIRSDDNTAAPVIGQPWSPDITKSPLDLPRVTSSPREPTMSVKACAGPMSPSDAGLFHRRWTTPPSHSSPDKARAYFNTKRSDSEKGMERIGRQLAHELHIPWNEYWHFLDQFIDLSTTAGLYMLEAYFKKRVWLTFVKDFKENYGINEQPTDFAELTTPVTNRMREMSVEDTDRSLHSIFMNDGNNKNSPSNSSDAVGNANSERKETDGLVKSCDTEEEQTSVTDVLSPVSNLLKCFEQMKLQDDSWSEKATVDSSEESVSNSDNSTCLKAGSSTANSNRLVKDFSVNGSDVITENNRMELDQLSKGNENGHGEVTHEEMKDNDHSPPLEEVSDLVDTKNSNIGTENLNIQQLTSVESESSASYLTAPEDVQGTSLSFCSQLSEEPGNFHVCLRLKDSAIVTKLTDHVKANKLCQNIDKDQVVVSFVVQVKDLSTDVGRKVNIVSIPEVAIVCNLSLFEDVDIASCDGDVSKVQEGEVLELRTSCGTEDENQSVMAYLTRAVTLPKVKYIHGPQPTREDLDVSRALGDVTLCPELHPNVFHWKISLGKFLQDTNYRWQSPAKLKSRLRDAWPQPSPLGKTSPIIPYGSPLCITRPPPNVMASDIRTKLFSSILEEGN